MSTKSQSLFLIVFAAVLCQSLTTALTHQLELTNATSDVITIVSDNPDLPGPFFYVCNIGVWTGYTELNYSNYGDVQIWFEINGACAAPLTTYLKSARAIGALDDNTKPSVSFLSDEGLGGDIVVTETGIPVLPFRVWSFVAINLDFVQFFDEVDYAGNSFCVDLWDDGETDWYWGWEDVTTPWNGSKAKSARVGCTLQKDDAVNIVKRPTPPMTSTRKNKNSLLP